MLGWVVSAAKSAGTEPVLVLHHQEEAVRAAFPNCRAVRQERPQGTGDAARSAVATFPEEGPVLVLAGDTPLLRPETLRNLLEAHGDALCTVLTARVTEPGAYGRIVRGADGAVERIVEAVNASTEELAIDEINTGVYCFDAAWLRDEALPALAPSPPKNEYYLTDVVAAAAAPGARWERAQPLRALVHHDANETMGVNDRWALAQAEAVLQARILHAHASEGVTFQQPATTRVEVGVTLGRDVTVGPGVCLLGQTIIGDDVTIGAHSVLNNTKTDDGVRIRAFSHCEDSVVGSKATIGPYARLRPGAVLEQGVRVGNFVEVKKSLLEAFATVGHLAYIGDARIGARSNIGAGTITCNYDGVQKSHTDIGSDAFIGSNTALVAPVAVGDGAIVGAGSVVVTDVPANAIAVARGDQSIKEDAAQRYRDRLEAKKAEEDGAGG
jgi:bifunctional UDP-N-acetylglucosamine pyrophosphorylase/glucosamine-1-phosphate N-acetyltransferase